jgi:hypothetical protein
VLTQLPPPGSVFVDFLNHVYNGRPETLSPADIFRNCEIILGAQDAAQKRQIVAL